ncbi:MAG: hypothetical protein L0Y58_17605 [Verrucomicrobia subdivision 3 bacterium]|nr:hypothetical protein [Limisphaerales bacterium]
MIAAISRPFSFQSMQTGADSQSPDAITRASKSGKGRIEGFPPDTDSAAAAQDTNGSKSFIVELAEHVTTNPLPVKG